MCTVDPGEGLGTQTQHAMDTLPMLNNSAADQVHKPSDADWVCFRRGGGGFPCV